MWSQKYEDESKASREAISASVFNRGGKGTAGASESADRPERRPFVEQHARNVGVRAQFSLRLSCLETCSQIFSLEWRIRFTRMATSASFCQRVSHPEFNASGRF